MVFSPRLKRNKTPAASLLSTALAFAILALALVLTASSAEAAPATWSTTPTNGNWVTTTENNWSTGVGTFPGATSGLTNTDTATFLTSSKTTIAINSASLNINNITFGVNTGALNAFTIGTLGGNSLLLTSGGQISIVSGTSGGGATETVNAALVLEPASATTAGTYTFSNASTNKRLQINGAVSGGTTTQGITLTLTGANSQGTTSISGAISNGGAAGGLAITKTSSGTWVLSGNNTYTGATIISGGTLEIANAGTSGQISGTTSVTVNSGGTLLLSGSSSVTDRINNSATVTLNGGTFRLSGVSEGTRVAQGVGALTLSSSSIIDLASTSLVHFAASNTQTWTGTLSIYNWSGTPVTGGGAEALLFGTNTSSLTAAQLSQISFYSDGGTTFLGTGMFATIGDGEVVPVPESSTWIGGALALAAVGFTQLRKRSRAGGRAVHATR